jgi:hypothetical protein
MMSHVVVQQQQPQQPSPQPQQPLPPPQLHSMKVQSVPQKVARHVMDMILLHVVNLVLHLNNVMVQPFVNGLIQVSSMIALSQVNHAGVLESIPAQNIAEII